MCGAFHTLKRMVKRIASPHGLSEGLSESKDGLRRDLRRRRGDRARARAGGRVTPERNPRRVHHQLGRRRRHDQLDRRRELGHRLAARACRRRVHLCWSTGGVRDLFRCGQHAGLEPQQRQAARRVARGAHRCGAGGARDADAQRRHCGAQRLDGDRRARPERRPADRLRRGHRLEPPLDRRHRERHRHDHGLEQRPRAHDRRGRSEDASARPGQ